MPALKPPIAAQADEPFHEHLILHGHARHGTLHRRSALADCVGYAVQYIHVFLLYRCGVAAFFPLVVERPWNCEGASRDLESSMPLVWQKFLDFE